MKLLFTLLIILVFIFGLLTNSLIANSSNAKTDVKEQDNYIYNYNVFPSEQCSGVNFKNMELMIMPHKTGSMRPTIYAGDRVLVVDYNPDKNLVLGDIVSNSDVLHRIVAIDEGKQTYRLKGDNNYRTDPTNTNFNETIKVVCGILRGTK